MIYPANTSRPANKPSKPIRLAKPRTALVVYRVHKNKLQFLLISSSRNPHKLTLPGGKVGKNESHPQAATRETIEEAGVLTEKLRPLGSYLHRKRKRRIHPTRTFIARFAGEVKDRESRDLHWLTLTQIANPDLHIRQCIREQLAQAAREIRHHALAA